jgi:hypothetical protein
MEDMTPTKGDQTHKNDCHARQTGTKFKTTRKWNDMSVSPETFNGTHNTEGEFRIRADPDILRERRKQKRE